MFTKLENSPKIVLFFTGLKTFGGELLRGNNLGEKFAETKMVVCVQLCSLRYKVVFLQFC